MRVVYLVILLFLGLVSNGQSFDDSYYQGYNILFSRAQQSFNMNYGKSTFFEKNDKIALHTALKVGITKHGEKIVYNTPNVKDDDLKDKIENYSLFFGSLNLNLGVSYNLTEDFLVGLESDLLGFNLSSNSEGRFLPSLASQNDGPTRDEKVAFYKPNQTNLMLFSKKNQGVIQNALYALVVTDFAVFKFSISHISTHIKTDSFIGHKGNNRFVNNDFLIGIGITSNIF